MCPNRFISRPVRRVFYLQTTDYTNTFIINNEQRERLYQKAVIVNINSTINSARQEQAMPYHVLKNKVIDLPYHHVLKKKVIVKKAYCI